MSSADYIANAFVRVLPDSTGFRGVLSKQVRDAVTAVPVSARSVLIAPSTVGFQAAVRKQVRAAIVASGTHTVPVSPTLGPFRADFAAELRKTPIQIPVVPDMAPFLSQLRAQVAAANKGLQVIIPVVTGDISQAKALENVTRSAISTTTFLQKVEDNRAKSRVRVNAALVDGVKAETALKSATSGLKLLQTDLQRVEEALAVARQKKNTAAVQSLTIVKKQLESDIQFVSTLQKQLTATVELERQSKKKVATTIAATAATKALTQEERELLSVETTLSGIQKSRVAAAAGLNQALNADIPLRQKLVELDQAAVPLRASLIETERALGTAVARTSTTLTARLKSVQSNLQSEIALNLRQRASLITRAAETEVIGVNIKSLTSLADVKKVETALTRLQTAAQEHENIARRAGVVSVAEQLAALRGELTARAELLAAQRAGIREQARQVSQQKLLARGAGATGLSLLGVRGATLAASGAFLAGAAAVASFAKAIKTATGLEQELNVFAETAGATSAQLQTAADEARRLGADITLPAVNAADAAQAFTSLAKAGLDVENSLSGARGVLQLATAANIENAEATQLVASGLNAFGLAGEDATRVADLLTGAANEAQGSISDMGVALQQSAAVARLAGISLEDTVAFLTLLARNGLRGSDAGTSLRTALTRLIRPTDKAAEAINKLGINIRDASGNIRADVFDQFTEALSGVSRAQQDATLALIFGQDALRAAAILGREGAVGLDAVREATQQSGLAAELAGARTKGFGGQVEALKNTIETTGAVIGASLLPPLGGIVEALERGVSGLGESQQAAAAFGGALQGTIGAVRGFSTVVGELAQLGGTVLAPLISTLATVAEAFGNLGTQAQAGLVGGFLAFRVIQRVDWLLLATRVSVVGDSIRAVAVEMKTAAASANGFAAAMLRLRAAFIAFARSPAGIALAVAAAVAGLLYFVTRTSDAERATRSFKEANDDLVLSLEAVNTALRGVQDARTAVETGEIDLQRAIFAQRDAQNALGASRAAPGSGERVRLQTELRAATLAREEAEQRLAEALRQVSVAEDEADQARRNNLDALREQRNSLLDVIGITEKMVDAFGNEARGRRQIISVLQTQARENQRENTEESRRLAQRQLLLARFIAQTEDIPSQKQIDIILQSGNAEAAARRLAETLGIEGDRAQKLFVERLLNGLYLLPPKVSEQLKAVGDAGRRVVEDVGTDLSERFNDAFVRGVSNLGGRVASELQTTLGPLSLPTQIIVAEAQGAGDAQLLRLLQAQRARQQAFLNRVLNDPELRSRKDLVQKAASNLESTNNQIQAILDRQASDAEQHRQDVIKARNEADQAILDSIGAREQALQNNLVRAEGTKALRDDLRAQIAIRNFWRNIIKNQIQTIKDAQTRAAALRDAQGNLLRAQQEVKETREAMREAIRDQQSEVREALELNIEFLNITENVSGEIRARQRLIRHLRRMQKEVRKGSNEWRQLRNDIAREQAAIKELKEQTQDRNREFKEMAFAFLTTQQGFAATVMSNLLGAPAVSGAVGGTSQPGRTGFPGERSNIRQFPGAEGFGGGLGEALIRQQLQDKAGAAAADGRGVSAGQAATIVQTLRQIASILLDIRSGGKHKGSRKRQEQAGAGMDTM